MASADGKIQAKSQLLYQLNSKRPDLVARCKNLSLEQNLSDYLSGTSGDKLLNKQKVDSKIKYSFYQNIGHSINECRKKKRDRIEIAA